MKQKVKIRNTENWLFDDIMRVYGMPPNKDPNCCKNCVRRDLEYISDTCEICTIINKKVGKLSICDFYTREIINK